MIGYGCLPLDGPCYMLKCWTGAYCRYFRDAVLPNDPVLEAATAEGPVPKRGPARSVGILSSRMAGHGIALRPVRYCPAKQSGDYMRKTRR